MRVMLIKVKVSTRASKNEVKKEEGRFKVYTTAAPERDKANKSVIGLLADFFKKKPSDIIIIAGRHSRAKTIQINS